MISLVHTAPSLIVKLNYPGAASSKEKVIGYAYGLVFRVLQGQKEIFAVDSPFPVEIAQGAAPSLCRGSMSIYLPKGQTPESLGLVPYRILNGETNVASMAYSKYFNLRVYDRLTAELVFSADYVKAGEYAVNIQARGIVRVDLNFSGLYLTPGNNH